MSISLLDLAVITCIATVAAAVLFALLQQFGQRKAPANLPNMQSQQGPVFLFRDEVLIDGTREALSMIAPHNQKMSDFEAALHVLDPHFPNLREKLAALKSGKTLIADKKDGTLRIEIEKVGENLRLAISSGDGDGKGNVTDVIERDVRLSELAMLRELTQHTPQLIWQENKDGRLMWANRAYLMFSDGIAAPNDTTGPAWPNASIFPDLHENISAKGSSLRRIAVTSPDKKAEHWFDVTSITRNDGFLHFGADANAAVRADQERRNFVQTLGKTFAHLSIGLAIFDKRRQLAMFNPALLDLTRLSAEFLSGRPTIDTVLDKLRESRVLPEPKNYASWRDQFTALEAEAKNGTYCEVWNLPDGQTYRVTGRPHPDGAFAFLFEDISAEVSLNRRFRSDIETGQSVLDTLTDAIAVFSSAGTLVMSNQAYADLWSTDRQVYIDQRELQSEIAVWQNRCTPTLMWTEMREFIHRLGARKPWSDDAILDDGRQICCHANPIAGGMTMVRFTFAPPMKPIIRKLTMPDTVIHSTRR
jgi:PAS domain-containing protein